MTLDFKYDSNPPMMKLKNPGKKGRGKIKNIGDVLALTPLQEGLLFHYLKNPGSNYYFEQLSIRLSGPLDIGIFEQAWNIVIDTNEMLRTVFRWEKLANPVQLVLRNHTLQLRYHDLSHQDLNDSERQWAEIKNNDWHEKFDLHEVPFRVTLAKFSHETFEMIISNHHILYDGWSNGIILKEFFDAYRAIVQGREPLNRVKTSFKEFIDYLHRRDKEKECQFWQEYLAGFAGRTEMASTKDREPEGVTSTALYTVRLPVHIAANLEASSRSNKVSMAALLYTAWGLLLQRYCNNEDVVFGTTVSGRSAKIKSIEEIVGLFINTLPLRVRTVDSPKIEVLLQRINQMLQMREEHEHTSPADIAKYSEPGIRGELFDSIIVIENYPLDARLSGETGNLSIVSYSLQEASHYNLAVVISLLAGIEITFNYFKSIWKEEMIRLLADHFLNILENIITSGDQRIDQIEMLSAGEKRQLLEEFNNTGANYSRDKTIQQIFVEQAAKSPDRIALVGEVEETYRQLDEQSGRLADILIEKGGGPGYIVGLMIERSIEMITAILGILKSGSAYLPIDPHYPHERINYMLEDSSVKILINKSEKKHYLGTALVLDFEYLDFGFVSNFVLRASNFNLSNLAYIIYTSGSTGQPKGVMVTHRNVLRLINNTNFVPLTPETRILQTGAAVFDATTFEIWGSLLNGGQLVLVQEEIIIDAQRLSTSIKKYRINTLWLSSPLFNRLMQEQINLFAPLRYLLVGGDVLSPVHINRVRKQFPLLKIINGYGPTENTTFSTTYQVEKDFDFNIPIGRPITNSTAYIVDRWNHLQPIGVAGELLVGGEGVANGYLNNPELTADSFKRNVISQWPFVNGKFQTDNNPLNLTNDQCPMTNDYFYSTGDLARWLPDPSAPGRFMIEFKGRIDQQVKIRGYRVEPGEIERRLSTFKDIKEAAVIARPVNEEKCLCAYIVIVPGKEKNINLTELRQYLAHKIPNYMMPTYFTVLDSLPLTVNGKIDRQALPLPGPGIESRDQFTAYRDETEKLLTDTWSQILGIDQEKIGIDHNFFECGGHSLKAMQLTGKIHKYFNIKIPVSVIFAAPTIRKLAEYIKTKNTANMGLFEPFQVSEKKSYYELSAAQQRIYMFQQMHPQDMSFHISSAMEINGKIEPGKLFQIFMELIRRHESLRTSFIQVEGKPVQRIHDPDEIIFNIEYHNSAVEATSKKQFIRTFNLSHAPLLRVGLLKNGIILIDMHHIISDGTSVAILQREFQTLYAGEELPGLEFQYKDFCQWQNRMVHSEEMKKHAAYWCGRLNGKLPLLDLPIDYPRPAIQSFVGDCFYLVLEQELTKQIGKFLLATGTTLYMLLLTALNILLYRYSGQEDIIIGSVVAGRDHADLEKIVGLVTGSLLMRNFPCEHKTFTGFLEEIKHNTLQDYEHQAYPYEEILRTINHEIHPGRNPFSDIALIVQNMNSDNEGSQLLKKVPVENFFPLTSKLDMTLIAEEKNGAIHFTFEYSTDLFKRETIERLAHHLVNILKNGMADPRAYLTHLEMMTPNEKQQYAGTVDQCYPLSHAQKRIYYTEKKYSGTPVANLGFTIRYKETLDMELLETAINRVIKKNDGLRMRIVETPFEKEPLQYAAPFERQPIHFIDFSNNNDAQTWLETNRTVYFDSLNSRLFDFVRLRFNEKESGYYLKIHHIIADGWTIYNILAGQIDRIYNELTGGKIDAGDFYPSYLQYLSDEKAYLASGQLKKDKEFWRGMLLPLPQEVRLSTRENGSMDIKAGLSKFVIPPGLTQDIYTYTQSPETKTSLYKLIFTIFAVYISRAAGLDDFVIGSTNHNRCDDCQKQMVGMFAGTIPIRVHAIADQGFRAFVEKNGDLINQIIKNYRQYPFDMLAVEVGEETGVDLNYLLNVNFISQGDIENDHYKIDTYFSGYDPDQLTIYLGHKPADHILELEWNYRETLFTPAEISRMNNSMMVILADAIRHPDKKLAELELLSAEEKKQILENFNDNSVPFLYPIDLTLPDLFSQQVERTPGRVAVLDEETGLQLSYRQIDEQSGNTAFLLQEKDVQPEDIVAVMMEPSAERIIVLLGILKAGAAYLPIDPGCPAERCEYMLKDSGAKIIINEKFLRGFRDPRLGQPGAFQKSPLGHKNQAYIIYTSGSTGRPKGVVTSHRNVLAYLTAFANEFQLNEADVVIQQASYTFDAFVEEMYPILLKGGKLAVSSRETIKDINLLAAFIARHGVSLITCSPLSLNQLNSLDSHESIRSVHTFISGGDVLNARFIDKLLKIGQVYNTYGPTESTVCITYYRCSGSPGEAAGKVPIGKPIANYKVYLLDKNQGLIPMGVPGEICVAGPGVARGYLNNPELTADRFKRNVISQWSFVNGKFQTDNNPLNLTNDQCPMTNDYFYSTGDLGRWLDDGNIEFLGRVDNQVKIRGFRIETGEIEARLLGNPLIEKAVVVVREDETGDPYLAAYFLACPQNSQNSTNAAVVLREYLARSLPDYMVPAHFIPVTQIPLTPGGKVDRNALPKPGWQERKDDNYIAPRDEIEKSLASLWCEVLAIPRVGIDDNFFQCGGHSLKASIMAARVQKTLDVKIPLAEIFRYPTIRELARYISTGEKSHYTSAKPTEKKEFYPLSPAQKRLYLVHQLAIENTGYNITAAWELEGDFDQDKLQAAFQRAIHRHESFRTSFQIVTEEPVQRIHAPGEVKFEITCYDLITGDTRDQHSSCIMQTFIRPFDLSCAPLLRVGLARIAEKKHLLLLDMHHIIADGVSLSILVKEFTLLYAGHQLPDLKLQYKDYSEWQHKRLKKEIAEAAFKNREKYWLEQYRFSDIPALNLPIDYLRPAVQTFTGSNQRFTLNEADTAALRSLAEKKGTTVFILLLAIFNVLLAKLSSQEDIIVGTSTAGRNQADIQDIIGMFVNTLALRNFPIAEKPFLEFLHEVKEKTLAAFENQDYPFENMVEQLKINRDPGRNPLFDVVMVLQNMDIPGVQIPGLTLKPYEYEKGAAIFDMTWQIFESGPTLLFVVEFNNKLFKHETIQRFTGYWQNLVKHVCLEPADLILNIDILTQEEKRILIFDFNDTGSEYPDHKTIHELFVEQAEKIPDAVALVGAVEGEEKKRRREEEKKENQYQYQTTYRELNNKADNLAGLLIEKGVESESIVGIKSERSLEMIIGILGILKAGGSYLPIDPAYPQERIDYMLKDSGAKLLVTTNDKEGEKVRKWEGELLAIANGLEGEKVRRWEGECRRLHHSAFDIPRIEHSNSNHLAYIIYTSGTMGHPKGVMVEHRNVVRLVKNTNYVEFKKGDRILQTGALEFDASTFEIWGTLLNGLMLLLISKEQVLSPPDLRNAIEKYDIRTMWLTSSLFNRLLDAGSEIFAPLHNLLVGGEALSPVHINKLRTGYSRLNIINGYGPTENTTFSTTFRINKEYTGNIPIGKPIANSTAYIVNRWHHLQPIGVPGELYVGGHGVARGYLNNPELTADRFKRNVISQCSFVNGKFQTDNNPLNLTNDQCPMTNDYFYRTGDLCRWLADGNIEFLGRIDGQIKLRGFRIELAEIESRLSAHHQVKEAVVVLREKNFQSYLCAYFVPVHETPVLKLREYLAGVLPNYMIPSHFVSLDKIPLTPNGKLDQWGLPEPEIEISGNFEAPDDEIDWRLAEIWADVLGIDKGKISIHDDFFQLGGHSLKAAILTAHIHKVFNVKIQLIDIFTNPILKNLSQHIKKTTEEVFRAVNTAEKKEYYPLTPAQKRLFILQQMDPGNTTYNIPAAFTLAWDKEQQPDLPALKNTIHKIINRHESLRTSFLIINGGPVQKIHEKIAFEIENPSDPGNLAAFIRPFDLAKAPLLRMGLLKLAEREYILILDMHHIIADGTSLNIFAGEFMALHKGTELPALKIHYKDFAVWHSDFLEKDKMASQENYWLKQFAGEIPILDLLADFTRPAVQSFDGSRLMFEIGNGCKEALRALSRKEGVTLYMLILAVINILFAKLGRQEDIIVGMPTAGRRHADLQPLIGMFVNTLALRNYPLAHKTFREFLGEVKQNTLAAMENQEYPFEDLVEKVVVNRDPGRNPLFDVMFVLQNMENVEIEIPGLKLKPFEIPNQISKFDLTLIAVENGPKILFTIEYCTALFKEETIKRFTRYLKKLLLSVLGKPGRKICEIEIIPGEERRRILYDFNKTGCEYPHDKTIHELFVEQAEKIPDAVALVGAVEGEEEKRRREEEKKGDVETLRTASLQYQITYRELNEQSNHLAGLLIAKGLQLNDITAIMLKRSIELIISLLGVLKAGGIYLPIDPNYPHERIDYMLKDSKAKLTINYEFLKKAPQAQLYHSLFINHHSQLAYIIYTSGSTGQPKGVLVRHEGFVNLIHYHQQIFGEGPGIKMSQVANPGFDAMAFEAWPCLANGATLYIVDEETRLDPVRMKQWLIEKEISITFQPTIIAEQLLNEIWPDEEVALKTLMTAGDKLTRFPVRKYPFKFYNLYGPTEDTVWTTWTEVPMNPDGRGFPSIGKPIGNHRVYITGPHLELLPLRVPGELCIDGIGLAAGYINNPERTAEKFINFHHSSFAIPRIHHSNLLYRTGDLASWLDDGNIEFLGRIDGQVKLRGFRIELGEIESRLIAYPGIKEAVVVLKEKDHQSYLSAYYAAGHEIASSALREYLNNLLPAYMVPAYFVALDRFPLTPNGKVDLRALPEPVIKTKENYEGPVNFVEEKLVETWQEVLDIKGIGVHDNFFEMGGDSIKGVQIISRLQKYNLKMEVANLFLHPTIREVAALIKKNVRLANQETVTGKVELTPIQKWFFESDFNHRHHFNQAVMVYRETGFDESIVSHVFQRIVEHHDALRMVFARKNLQIVQHNRGLGGQEGKLFNLQVFDFHNEPGAAQKIENEAGHLQASIDLENGPLVHLGLFKTDKGDHLLIIVHHLVIDGVSWRILLEDFAAGYGQALQGASIKFQAKTHSFKEWAAGLSQYAANERLLKELAYWQSFENGELLPKDSEIAVSEKKFQNFETIELKLNKEETETFMRLVHRAYRTEINDILLAGLISALHEWCGIEKVLVNLEGHGREKLMENIDINRTIGWFTSQYPVLLKPSRPGDTGYLIKEVKETLRQVPGRGTGYGILRYLTPAAKKQDFPLLRPEIDFNYLGEFSGLNNDIFQVSGLKTGQAISPEMKKETVLDISGLTSGGQLTLFISYNSKQYKQETMARLADVFKANLKMIIEHCASREFKGLTPADLTYRDFTIAELNGLINRWPSMEDVYELAPMQAGMLYHALKANTSGAYFQQTVFTIRGNIDKAVLQRAFQQLIDRYEVLRTVFHYENVPQPVQIVLKQSRVDFVYRECEEGKLPEFYREDREKGFNLAAGPLIRLALVKTGDNWYRLVYSFHHILMDGWCLGIIFKELLHIYRCLRKGVPISLKPAARYRDYIKWLKEQEIGPAVAYWHNYLEGCEHRVELPRERKAGEAYRAYRLEEYSVCLEEILWKQLKALTSNYRVTVNTLMQTVWGILLQRYTDKDDVVFGAVTSGRPPAVEGIENMVGLFINTVPIRIKAGGKKTFGELLHEVQAEAVSSRTYEYLSLADIQACSSLKEALIDHIMVFENYPLDREIKNNLNPTEYDFTVADLWAYEQTNYDFNISISELKSLAIKFSYNASVYDKEFAARTWVYLKNIFTQVVERSGLKTAEIEIITEEEKHRILFDFNNTAAQYQSEKTIHQLFTEQAVKSPDRIALVGAGEGEEKKRRREEEKSVGANRHPRVCPVSLSYRQLNGQSDRLAGALIEKGVQGDHIVGIKIARSLEMIIGILGILKSGGAYLPIDPAYPQERIDFMLKDSSTKLVVDAEWLKNMPSHHSSCDIPLIQLIPLIPLIQHSKLAYIIYTSGSTGKPKGVMIEHASVVNILYALQYQYPFTPADTYLLKTTYLFDVSVTELFGWYMGGGRLALLEKNGEKDPQIINKWVQYYQVTHINFVPSMFQAFLDFVTEKNKNQLLSLKYIFLAGEALLLTLVDRFKTLKMSIQLENLYGPTEGTVYSSCYSVTEGEGIGNVPIGKPLPNIKLYILNKYNHFQALFIPGELCISGVGLARGYLNNPELTAERFSNINRSYWSDKTYIFYKTGDLCRWLADGNIEFLGRIDSQVKIRGFRIELGEVENVILKHDDVQGAVVLAKAEGFLGAYFTAQKELPDALLREHTAAFLPGYMVPSYFIQLEKLPLTPSGKIDRHALPEPGLKVHEYTTPTGRVEEKLVEIWAGILNIPNKTIGAETNFFHLGGHSLRATVLMLKIHKLFNIKIPIEEIFKNPTIKGLAAYIKNAKEDKFIPIAAVEEKEYYVLSASQYRFYMFQQLEKESTIYNIPEVLLLQGNIDRVKLEKVFQALIKRHESFRTGFVIIDGEVVQQIHRNVDFEIEYYDLTGRDDPSWSPCEIIKNFIRSFDLSRAPLLRAGLIKLEEEKHVLLVDSHHIISDGASQTLFIQQFMNLYSEEKLKSSPVLNIQYKDYAEWQNTEGMRKILHTQETYWLNEFSGDIPVCRLPFDSPRPENMHFAGSMINFEIESKAAKSLKSLAGDEGISLFGLVLTLLNILLAKITRQEDICIGTQVAGRRHPDLQQIIGVFLNTLVLRNFPTPGKTFKEFLHQVMERTLQVFENQEYPFESLVEKILGKRAVNRNPLFDVMLVWQNFERLEIQVPGLTLKPYPYEHKSRALTDLSLYGWETGEKLSFTFEYSTELFEKGTILRFIIYFKEIITMIINNKEIKLKDIKISHDLGIAESGLLQDSDNDFGF